MRAIQYCYGNIPLTVSIFTPSSLEMSAKSVDCRHANAVSCVGHGVVAKTNYLEKFGNYLKFKITETHSRIGFKKQVTTLCSTVLFTYMTI